MHAYIICRSCHPTPLARQLTAGVALSQQNLHNLMIDYSRYLSIVRLSHVDWLFSVAQPLGGHVRKLRTAAANIFNHGALWRFGPLLGPEARVTASLI